MKLVRKLEDIQTIYGFFGLFSELVDRRRCWHLEGKFDRDINQKSSISDVASYVKICEIAVKDPLVFRNFRRCFEYRLILEHVSKRFGNIYLGLAQENPRWKSYVENIKLQNQVGNPILKFFNGVGKISPTGLRYLKVLVDLEKYFGNLNQFSIAEIGAGFGGQAHAITSNFHIRQYSIYDLPEINELVKKFLSQLSDIEFFKFEDGRNIAFENVTYDLLISNYAFSELNRSLQEKYLRQVILKSKRGYITWNELSFKRLGGYSVDDLLQAIPGSWTEPEKPLTYPNNVIILWNN